MLGYMDSGTLELLSWEQGRLCRITVVTIQIPAMSTRGIPMPSPTPRPTFTASVLEAVLEKDAGAAIDGFPWEVALDVGPAIMLAIEDVNGSIVDDEL